jgi:hypothetical protein
MGFFRVRQSGNVGKEILDRDGKTIARTTENHARPHPSLTLPPRKSLRTTPHGW